MDSIKKFFEKKKKDAKFKIAGQGKRLDSTPSYHMPSESKAPQVRSTPTADAQRAGAAAISRFESHSKKTNVDWSLQAIKARARKEMEMEKKMAEMDLAAVETETNKPLHSSSESSPVYAVQGVFFYFPLIGPETGTYDEIKSHIRDFLYNQMEEDKAVASCLIIQTCNKNKEKVSTCIETLCRYLENIINNPEEEKYQKIRMSNRAYEDRVAPIEGTKEFLEVAGFQQEELPLNDAMHKFWVFKKANLENLSILESLRDTLVSAEALKPELDRSIRVLLPQEASRSIELPPEFFAMTVDEFKREMAQRNSDFERSQMLLTKATRERMELREMKKYRFTLIRIRFPDGIILQGTFKIGEKFENLLSFVREHLVNDWRPFFLILSGGGKVTEEDKSLFELHLVPAVLFNFEWDSSISDPNLQDNIFLKEETLMLLNQLHSE